MTIFAGIVFIAVGLACGFGLFAMGVKYGMNFAIQNSKVLQQAKMITQKVVEQSKKHKKK